MNYFSQINEIRKNYKEGLNITKLLRETSEDSLANEAIIEVAYEMQAGNYVAATRSNWSRSEDVGAEIAEHLRPFLDDQSSLLDCGTGEMTSLAFILKELPRVGNVFAMDLSWSRLSIGREFFKECNPNFNEPIAFVGEMSSLALPDSSVDVVMTVHALEPNRGREVTLLSEVCRVARRQVVLVEPCYERAGPEAKQRMDYHGYVKGIEETLDDIGATVEDATQLVNTSNPLNPSWVFKITPPNNHGEIESNQPDWICPNSADPLTLESGWLFGKNSGLAYPILENIPLLRQRNAVLASVLGG